MDSSQRSSIDSAFNKLKVLYSFDNISYEDLQLWLERINQFIQETIGALEALAKYENRYEYQQRMDTYLTDLKERSFNLRHRVESQSMLEEYKEKYSQVSKELSEANQRESMLESRINELQDLLVATGKEEKKKGKMEDEITNSLEASSGEFTGFF